MIALIWNIGLLCASCFHVSHHFDVNSNEYFGGMLTPDMYYYMHTILYGIKQTHVYKIWTSSTCLKLS